MARQSRRGPSGRRRAGAESAAADPAASRPAPRIPPPARRNWLPARRPSSRISGWAMQSKAVKRGLRLSFGSWKTIWNVFAKARAMEVARRDVTDRSVRRTRCHLRSDRSGGRSCATSCSCRTRICRRARRSPPPYHRHRKIRDRRRALVETFCKFTHFKQRGRTVRGLQPGLADHCRVAFPPPPPSRDPQSGRSRSGEAATRRLV